MFLFHNKKLNHKITRLNERYARVPRIPEMKLLSQYIIEICKYWLHKCLESTMGYLKKHLTKILPLTQPFIYNIRI